MKPGPWLLPVLAALAAGGWIFSRKTTASALEREILVVNERIQQAREAESAENPRAAGDKEKTSKDRAINWKEMASAMRNDGPGPGDMRAMMRMQRLLLDLSAEELCAQLDEIAALDLDERVRLQLESMIFGSLAEKDPKLALDHFAKRPRNEDFGSWQMAMALGKWAEKDTTAATAWLDQRIASGAFESKKLDGQNPELLQMERSLVAAMLKQGADAAIARVKAMPEDRRGEFFRQGGFFQVDGEQSASYVRLVREAAPEKDVAGILAERAGFLAMNGGFEKVDAFIATARASREEKEKIVEQVMGNNWMRGGADPDRLEGIEKTRAWAATQAPAIVDKATGEALARTLWTSKGDFNKAAELAEKFSRESGNDETLAAFLMSQPVRSRSKDPALEWADKIQDPAKRQQVRDFLEGKDNDP